MKKPPLKVTHNRPDFFFPVLPTGPKSTQILHFFHWNGSLRDDFYIIMTLGKTLYIFFYTCALLCTLLLIGFSKKNMALKFVMAYFLKHNLYPYGMAFLVHCTHLTRLFNHSRKIMKFSLHLDWNLKLVFCFENYFYLLWEKIILVIEKNFWDQ